jgi:adenosylcobinamide kinase/adenosylcobinamide-phosphate guanylyltransferase
MAEIILITGGARSGKSRHALQMAESLAGEKLFVATSPVTDPEMHRRIERHREERRGAGWQTVEETVELHEVLLANRECRVALVDCLTLWVNNLLFTDAANELTEDLLSIRIGKVIEACRERRGTVLLVTNEVGLGIVPENPLARRYRDLVGRCNQEIGAAADRVVMTICGIPLEVKGVRG